MGWDEEDWDGMRWDGMGRDGMGRDGLRMDGVGGVGETGGGSVDCLLLPEGPQCCCVSHEHHTRVQASACDSLDRVSGR